MQPSNTIKPEYTPFVIIQSLAQISILLVVGLVLTSIVSMFGLVWSLLVIAATLLLIALIYANRHVKHHKTRTEFYNQRIIHYTGGLFSNRQTTLEIHNITHVELIHPFIRNHLFSTSHLYVQAAGSGSVEVRAQDFLRGEETYEYLQELMRHNGFSLKRSEHKQREKPLVAAVILKNLATAGLLLVFVAPSILIGLLSRGLLGALVALILLALAAGILVLRVLDELRREYDIYDDTIEYHEGFLTKKHNILPAENLAEANNNQTIIDRLLGASNLVISTQGSGQTSFSNMPRGEELEKTIDELAKAYKPLTKQARNKQDTSNKQRVVTSTKQPAKRVATRTEFSGNYQQHFPRALFSAVITALAATLAAVAYGIFELITGEISWVFIAFIIAAIFVFTGGKVIFEALFTRYEVRERGIYQQYEVLQRTTQEFTDDKLVGLEMKRTVLDQLMGTASITFQSLSSAPNITFKFQKNHEELLKNLQEKYYLDTPHEQTIQADYQLRSFFTKNFLLLTSAAVGVAGLLALATFLSSRGVLPPISSWLLTLIPAALVAGVLLYATLQIPRYNKSHLQLHEAHLEHEVGFLTKKREIVRYEDLKYQYATNYKLSQVGGLYLGIGGVSAAQNNQQQSTGVNGFLAAYLPAAHDLTDAIDKKILGSNEGFNQATKTGKPSLTNPTLQAIMIAPFTLLLSIVYLPIALWRTSRYDYKLEEQRVIEYRGVWNRTKHTVTYTNIDHLATSQGFINQLAKNGSVSIYTLGSQSADLRIRNVSDYPDWQQAIEERYH